MSETPDIPDPWSSADEETLPGEHLSPEELAEVKVCKGWLLAVWSEYYDPDTDEVHDVRIDLEVIGVDGDDIIAIPEDSDPLETERVFRIHSDLEKLTVGYVTAVPEFDAENSDLVVRRSVGHRGGDRKVLEVRLLEYTRPTHTFMNDL